MGDRDEDVWPRIVARHRGGEPGPLVVVVCALHGNEVASVPAARRVVGALATVSGFRGEIVALHGNRAAAAAGVRYIDGDMNRRWGRERVAAARAGTLAIRDAEDAEQIAFLAAFDAAVAGARTVVGVDLHSFSAEGAPFTVVGRSPACRALAAAVGLPGIASLERYIAGTMLELFMDEGHAIVGVEAGRHADPATAARHEAALWAVLRHLGMVAPGEVPVAAAPTIRRAQDADLPGLVEVVHRHPVAPGDGFAMRPGFVNFQRVTGGQPLADDASGVIVAPFDSWLLMPLYQGQGADGFFLAVEPE